MAAASLAMVLTAAAFNAVRFISLAVAPPGRIVSRQRGYRTPPQY